MQHIIRTVVRRIEIDDTGIEIIFRVPPPDGPPGVEVTKLGRSRLISPADQSWDAFFDGPGASNDFMAERRQPRADKCEQF
jgi:virulence-associated protein VagC